VTGYRGWRAYRGDYPDLTMSDAVPISIQLIQNHPWTFMSGIFQAYRDFVNPTRFFSFLYVPDKELPLLAYVMAILLIVGIARLVRVRRTILGQMLLSVIAGILLSVPFAPPIDDGIRAMMVTAPFWVLIVGLSFADLSKVSQVYPGEWKLAFPRWSGLLLFSLLMLASVTLGWLLVWGAFQPAVAESQCGAGEHSISLLTSPGSYVHVVKNNASSRSWHPDLRREDVRANAKNFSGLYSYDALSRMQAGQSLLFGLNLAEEGNKDFLWLIVPTETIKTPKGINSFCAVKTGQPQLDQASFYVESRLKGFFEINH
jgi:hypothetical protein